jgi:hypothetical protein
MSTLNPGTFVPQTSTTLQTGSSIPTPTEHDRQALRQEVLQEWIRTTDESIEALLTWRAYLQVWLTRSDISPAPDDTFFMSLIGDIDQAGLLDWLDGNPAGLDTLREVVTGTAVEANVSLLDYLDKVDAS